MIRNTRQNWEVGRTVRVGFLQLTVCEIVKTPGNYLPDGYVLANADQSRFYSFIPHNGIQRADSRAHAVSLCY